jgi:hypothetical protein
METYNNFEKEKEKEKKYDKALDVALDNRLKCYEQICNPYTGEKLRTLRDIVNIRLPKNEKENEKYTKVINYITECNKQFPLPQSLYSPPGFT